MPSAVVTRRESLPGCREQGEALKNTLPGGQNLPVVGPASTSIQSTGVLVTEDRLLQWVGALQSPSVVAESFGGDPSQYPAFIRGECGECHGKQQSPADETALVWWMQLCKDAY